MDTVRQSVDKVVERLATTGPTQPELQRVVTKMRSDLIDQMESPINRASLLAPAALFDGKPDRVNTIPAELAAVTPEQVKSFAQKYLTPSNRTIIERDPVASQRGEAVKTPGGKQ